MSLYVWPRFLKAGTEETTVWPRFLVDSTVVVDVVIPKFFHITDIVSGDVLRVAMKAGRHLEPRLRGRNQTALLPGRAPHGKSLRAKSFSRTTFLAYVTVNDSVNGKIYAQVEDRGRKAHLAAEIPYKDILVVQKYITPSKAPYSDETRAQSSALGVKDHKGFMNLIPVRF